MQKLVKIRLEGSFLPERAAWADGLMANLPGDFARALQGGAALHDDGDFVQQAAVIAKNLREKAAYTYHKPVSSRMPVNYQTVPGPVRRVVARGIGRIQRWRQKEWAQFPGFPLDLSADIAADLSGLRGVTFQKTPVLLSHDIDTAEGLRNMADLFLPLEEKYGARSVNFVVPCSWPIDHGLLARAVGGGHEIGVHGYDHANKTPFAIDEERRERIYAAKGLIDRYAIKGYRAPSLLRTRALLKDLGHHYVYDSSIPTSGGAFPVANNGCASARPWGIERLWELPLTLPRDGSLRFLGYGPDAIADMWIELAQVIARSGGIVFLLNHCEEGFSGNPKMLAAYEKFLAFIAGDKRFELTTPNRLLEGL